MKNSREKLEDVKSIFKTFTAALFFWRGGRGMKIQETSLAAYRSINRKTLVHQIVDCLRETNGLTCDELELELARSHQSVSSAIRGGVKQGLISDGGLRRKTRSGRQAMVWEAIDSPSSWVHPFGESESKSSFEYR